MAVIFLRQSKCEFAKNGSGNLLISTPKHPAADDWGITRQLAGAPERAPQPTDEGEQNACLQ